MNLSLLFTELPLLERAAAARAAGFTAVEFWWPFDTATPADAEVDGFVRAIDEAGVRLVSLNFFAGDMAAGDRGLVSWPGREREFADSVRLAVEIGRRLGCRTFNALYGNEGAHELALSNLDFAAAEAGRIGARLVLEPLSGAERYPLKTAADAFAVLDTLGRENVQLLFDLYHLGVNGDDLGAVIDEHLDRVGHVQVADAPGRHQPGTGSLGIEAYLARLAKAGYEGWVGLEYVPLGPSAESFDWLEGAR
ncbi:TIM barrel protein [Amycolatopsis acidicola]|uniref:TIM barrel protein n=1 Tax=Amycolatopsis acidicola TaxID=2596893 RepID=A0A5N0UTF5_9PSEU|nr:TIM barrel protein [Amycolatopsis acidicola]